MSRSKNFLARVLNEFLEPIRQRRTKYETQPELLKSILESGNEKVREEAAKTLAGVKRKIRIVLLSLLRNPPLLVIWIQVVL